MDQKLAYLECPTGIAGDMCLGALVHAGVPLDYLTEQLSRLGLAQEYHLSTVLVQRNGQQATKFQVELTNTSLNPAIAEDGADLHSTFHYPTEASGTSTAQSNVEHPGHTHHAHSHSHSHSQAHSHSHSQAHSHSHSHSQAHGHSHDHGPESDHAHTRHLPEIEQLIQAAGLPARARDWSLAVFRNLAIAEGAVHGIAPDQVHFHEVGATDAIVDIVGTCLGLDWLGIDQIYCSPLPTGGGTIRAAHGRLPVPTPAVLKLWEMRQVPIYHNGIERELVTPTGAAIATTLATAFGPPPTMTLQKIGLGAGARDLALPNMLRLWIGSTGQAVPATRSTGAPTDSSRQLETVTVLQTQIDDLNPQAIGYLFEVLLAAGALDLFTQPIGMKKSRPGILLTVICPPDRVPTCEAILYRETSTLGIRRLEQQRSILPRQMQTVNTEYGPVRLKLAWADGTSTPTNVQPEYEDCAQIARQHQIPWRRVHQSVLEQWQREQTQG